jgi:Peptidase family M28
MSDVRTFLSFVAAAVLAGCASISVGSSAVAAGSPSAGGVSHTAEAHVRTLLFTLAADSMEGRYTASPGGARAAHYIAGQMQLVGLIPAGDSGFFQRVPLAASARGFTLLGSAADWDTVSADRRRLGVNVVGVLPGADCGAWQIAARRCSNSNAVADTAVVIDAHYDHLGIVGGGTCRAAGSDSICNGADDDASGTVAILEIARAMASGPRPRRTLVFLATTGEEVGLLGTRWYVAHPVVPLERMSANLEIEMIDRPDSLAGGPGRAWLTGYTRSTMGDMLKSAGIAIVDDPRPCQSFFTRSDNIAFARAGIPAHTLSSFNLHSDYHQATDAADKADIPHMTKVIDAAIGATRILANGPAPTWHEGGRPGAGREPLPAGCPTRGRL